MSGKSSETKMSIKMEYSFCERGISKLIGAKNSLN